MLGAFYFQVRPRTGITTEMAALATYCLGFLAASPAVEYGNSLAIGLAIVVVAFLEAKRSLHKLIRETITENEFNDTLRFLAIIFIVYPILPAGEFGPYGFLAPRKIWLFVILVSSVSYAGYFLAKFLGVRRGVKLAGILGGLASTTAATLAFAARSTEEPENRPLYSQAAILANAIQFPRVLLILLVVSPALAAAALIPLATMTAAGLAAGLLLGRAKGLAADAEPLGLRNPFRLLPAIKFGVLFGAILFASKAGAAWFGGQAIYWTSGLAGSLDADAVALSLADLLARGSVSVEVGSRRRFAGPAFKRGGEDGHRVLRGHAVLCAPRDGRIRGDVRGGRGCLVAGGLERPARNPLRRFQRQAGHDRTAVEGAADPGRKEAVRIAGDGHHNPLVVGSHIGSRHGDHRGGEAEHAGSRRPWAARTTPCS